MSMKIAFYKAFQPKATLLDKAIAICTVGKYSHCEIIFSDNMAFSISPRENMARFKKIEFSREHWEVINIVIYDEIDARTKACNLQGYKYDYIGAFFSAIPKTHIEKENKLFCSEAVAYLLGLDKPFLYSPNDLFKKLQRNWK